MRKFKKAYYKGWFIERNLFNFSVYKSGSFVTHILPTLEAAKKFINNTLKQLQDEE